ncbi:hypothetical protein NC652_021575 [Populus alba x Populus x berolinensis]|uniref:Uncharacterized protein n=1 Tax=Populus alba x Populus x berolinensis TaxID=444605 RepID=A0AAD6QDN5_9ROSI|nr:hypothetical protein NC652_021575 [Populus alba x Populus x berolinensis]KAJ6988387.1 hypothetical protein NC653_021340 [Populus alba x Populus x berolinensis]
MIRGFYLRSRQIPVSTFGFCEGRHSTDTLVGGCRWVLLPNNQIRQPPSRSPLFSKCWLVLY